MSLKTIPVVLRMSKLGVSLGSTPPFAPKSPNPMSSDNINIIFGGFVFAADDMIIKTSTATENSSRMVGFFFC